MRADDMLKDDEHNRDFGGVNVRKGTIAAFIANVRVMTDPDAASDEISTARADIVSAVPALRAVGLLEVMSIKDERVRALVESVT
jgi:hypothetical protein